MFRIFVIIVCCTTPVWVAADTIYLANGETIEGKATQLSGDKAGYRIELAGGISVTLDRDQVNRVVESTPATELYANRANSAPDTVEAQLAIAKWCREQKLVDEFRAHLARVVELEPNHEEARSLLAFRKVDGEWLTHEEQMQQRGLVKYEGRYRTRQDIALRMREEAVTNELSDWRGKVKRWRRWLEDRSPDRVEEAVEAFKNLEEPLAAVPLVEIIKDEPNPKIRGLLLRSASQINHQETVNVLVVASVEDPDQELRFQALEYLVDSGRPGLVDPFAKLLRSPENVFVNRAAVALGSLGDKSAMGPLVDALITEHKTVIGSSSGGGDTYSFSPTTGGFSFGGDGPKVKEYNMKNPDVLSALVRLSGGETFGYNQERWRQWLATQATARHVNLRRID